MFTRILLPLDGSPLAESAISHALAMAKVNNAEVVVVRVIGEKASKDSVDPLEWHLRKTAAQVYIDTICTKFQENGVESHGLVLTGSPYQRIYEQVEKLNIDLVIINSHGKSGQVEHPFGAIAYKVVEGAGTSVMLVPAQEQPENAEIFVPSLYQTILTPLDGSLRAECVLPITDWLAHEQKIKLVVAHVVQRPDILSWALLAEDTRNLAEQFVEHHWLIAQSYLAQIQERQNLDTVSILTRAENVAIELSHIAEQNSVDLILVSAHGAAANPMRTFGDTVNGILNYCHQPVLIYQDRPSTRTVDSADSPVRERIERQYEHFASGPGHGQQAYL